MIVSEAAGIIGTLVRMRCGSAKIRVTCYESNTDAFDPVSHVTDSDILLVIGRSGITNMVRTLHREHTCWVSADRLVPVER